MKCIIRHESKGRMRVHFCQKHMTLEQADIAEYALAAQSGVTKVRVFDRTCDVIVYYSCDRSDVIAALAHFSYSADAAAKVPAQTGRALNREYENQLAAAVMRRIVHKFLLPMPLRRILSFFRALKHIRKGVQCLLLSLIHI